jgi:hypothetical protein
MFSLSWKSKLKSSAQDIAFSQKQQKLSYDVKMKYYELKKSYDRILKKMDGLLDGITCIEICREMLCFYSNAEDLLQIFIGECFRDRFMISVGKKREIFEIQDKVFKLMIQFDILKTRCPKVFERYSEMRILEDELFYNIVTEDEDGKISTLNMIAMPMGRLFLSMFSSNIFSLKIPNFSRKVSKIHLNTERQNRLGVFIYLCEIHQWKYMLIFLVGVFTRAIGNSVFDINTDSLKNVIGYLETMKRQL